MGASRGPSAAAGLAVVPAAALLLLAAACSQAPPPEPPQPPAAHPSVATIPPPQTVTPDAPTPPDASEDPVPAKVKGTEPILIEEGGRESVRGPSLAEVAANERERRQALGPSVATVDDKNLAQHASGALTTAKPAPPLVVATPDILGQEEHWRQTVRSIREEWAMAVDSILELEGRAAELRTRFYATDDPYVRDGQVKPAWDHTLQSLEDTRHRARQLEEELDATLEEGRQAGALPGWLREGIDLEPKERPYDPPTRRQFAEPDEGPDLVGEPVESDG